MGGSSDPERFLGPAEAAELLGVHPRTLSRWEQSGKLHVIRTVGGHRRYRRDEVLSLRAHVEGGPTEAVVPASEAPPRVRDREDRSSARRRALELLHAADVAGADPDPEGADGYARELVEGVLRERTRIDEMIASRAERWTIDRMPVVDRNLLRLAVFELLGTDVPTGVVVDEAVTLAKLLSTEGSGRFVNGILGRLARELRGH